MALKFNPCPGELEFHILSPKGKMLNVTSKTDMSQFTEGDNEFLLASAPHLFKREGSTPDSNTTVRRVTGKATGKKSKKEA